MIKRILLTEEAGESPHRDMNRETNRVPGAMRAWKACSARLNTNLKQYDAFTVTELAVFEREWPRCKRILQKRPDRVERPKLIGFEELMLNVYKTSGGDFGYRGEKAKAAWKPHEAASLGLIDKSRVEYMRATLKTRCHYTLPNENGDGLFCFKLVRLHAQAQFRSHSSKDDAPKLLSASIQRFSTWWPTKTAPGWR